MADDDISARGFCRYDTAIARLRDVFEWDRNKAHRRLCWAVRTGKLRIKRDPNARPEFDLDHWDHSGPGVVGVGGPPFSGSTSDLINYGNYAGPPEPPRLLPTPPPPPFKAEEYSIADLDQLIERERADQATPAAAEKGTAEGEKRRGGKPAQYPWDEFAVCFGALLWDERAGNGPEAMNEQIELVAQALGGKVPERTAIQEHRERWLTAYQKWKRKDDAGN